MKNQFFDILTDKAGDVATIFIYGEIGGFDWDTWKLQNTAKEFIEEFNALEKDFSHINIHINSPGGYIDDGLGIFNAISRSKSTVHTYVDGLAASMAAIIALAGDEVHIAENGIMMIHTASSFAWGNAQEMRDQANVLEVFDRALTKSIANKTGKTEEWIQQNWMNHFDTWFDSKEAKDAGLVDVIEGYQSEATPDVHDLKNMNWQRAAAKLHGFYGEKKPRWKASINPKNENPPKQDPMNLKALLAQLEAVATGGLIHFSAEDVESLVNEINAIPASDSVVSVEIHNQTTSERDALQNTVNAITEKLGCAEGEDPIAKAEAIAARNEELEELVEDDAGLQTQDPDDDSSDEDAQAMIDALPHNQRADKFLS